MVRAAYYLGIQYRLRIYPATWYQSTGCLGTGHARLSMSSQTNWIPRRSQLLMSFLDRHGVHAFYHRPWRSPLVQLGVTHFATAYPAKLMRLKPRRNRCVGAVPICYQCPPPDLAPINA